MAFPQPVLVDEFPSVGWGRAKPSPAVVAQVQQVLRNGIDDVAPHVGASS